MEFIWHDKWDIFRPTLRNIKFKVDQLSSLENIAHSEKWTNHNWQKGELGSLNQEKCAKLKRHNLFENKNRIVQKLGFDRVFGFLNRLVYSPMKLFSFCDWSQLAPIRLSIDNLDLSHNLFIFWPNCFLTVSLLFSSSTFLCKLSCRFLLSDFSSSMWLSN